MRGYLEARTDAQGHKRWRPVVRLSRSDPGGPKRIARWGSYARKYGAEGAQGALERALAELGGSDGAADLSVEQLIERWLRDGPARKATTIHGYRQALAHHIAPVRLADGQRIGAIPARLFSPAMAAEWQAQQLAGGRCDARHKGEGCAPKSVRDYRAVFCGALEWGAAVGLIEANPFARVPTVKVAKPKYAPPDLATMARYLEELRGTRYWLPVLIASGSGLRRGEILALRWSDYDEAAGTLAVTRNLTQAGKLVSLTTTKTDGSEGVLRLPAFVAAGIREARRERLAECMLAGRRLDPDERICAAIAKPDQLTHGLWNLFQRRGLPKIHMHLLRHAVATAMLRNGENALTVSRQLRHAQVATTLGMYGHLDERDLSAAAKRFDAAWSKAESERTEKAATALRGQVVSLHNDDGS